MKRISKKQKQQETVAGIEIYADYPSRLTYQNFGSAWLIILRGSTESIERTFYGLFNWGATNGEMTFEDHLETVAVFWSERKQMTRYFFNRYYSPRCNGNAPHQGRLVRQAMRYAWSQLDRMAKECHEHYRDFSERYSAETFGSGIVCAEHPDTDMKDAILAHAFEDRSSAKVVDFDANPAIL